MHTIETTATVGADGTVTIDSPIDAPPGRHRVILVLDEHDELEDALESHDGSGWPPGYFEQTFGASADEPLTRELQGDYEEREALG